MKALIQRVSMAEVWVNGLRYNRIENGILLLLGIDKSDTRIESVEPVIEKLAHKVLHYRIFEDGDKKMNLNVQEIEGSVLIVSQFTISADTKKGLRPSFAEAAEPGKAEHLYNQFVSIMRVSYPHVKTGVFGAHMEVGLVNDGPVTFMLTSDCKR